MSSTSSKKIAFNYFGGKFSWLEHLYDYFPKDFIHLVDVFGGSFAVTLNYDGKVVKTANEINASITNFFSSDRSLWGKVKQQENVRKK